MSKFRLSIAAVAALGVLGTANAGTFAEAIENASVSGGGFFRYTSASLSDFAKNSLSGGTSTYDTGTATWGDISPTVNQPDNYKRETGNRYQFRGFLDISSAAVDGYTVNFGLLFNAGAVPMPNATAYGDLGGSRFFDVDTNAGDGLNVNALNISKSFGESGVTATVGTIKLATPITTGGTDRGLGALVTAGTAAGTVVAGVFDSWVTDNLNRGVATLFTETVPAGTENTTNSFNHFSTVNVQTVENNLYVLGLLNSTKEGVYYNAFLANVSKFVNYIGFAEAGFSSNGLKVGAQIAAADVRVASDGTGYLQVVQGSVLGGNKQPTILAGDAIDNLMDAGSRGIYNIQASYGADIFDAKVGYTGSFGEGYGVFPTNQGAFNLGGVLWYNTHGNGVNGINIFGAGSQKGSSVQVVYLNGGVKPLANLKVSLDVASVNTKGWNQAGKGYAYTNADMTSDNNDFATVSFFEVTPSITYTATKNINFHVFYGTTFGDVKYSLGRVQANYKF